MSDITIEKAVTFGTDKFAAIKLFLAHILTVSASLCTDLFGPYGLLGYILPTEEYLLYPDVDENGFQRLVRPVLQANHTARGAAPHLPRPKSKL